MPKAPRKQREEARQLFLTGAMVSNSEIAAHLKIKPHTVGTWRREEDWDGLRRKVDRRAAELLIEKLATDRSELSERHYRLWELVLNELLTAIKDGKADAASKTLDKVASIIERAQKGQRLARGLAMDGDTEEKIRAESQAEIRHLIDMFIEAVKENVPDENSRERIRQAIFSAVPEEAGERTGAPGDEGDL